MNLQTKKPILLLIAVLFLNACKDKVTEPLVPKEYAKIQIYHAAVDANTVDLLVDSVKINTDSLVYSKGIPYSNALLHATKKNFVSIISSKSKKMISGDSIAMNNVDVGYTFFVYQDAAKTARTIFGPDNLLAPGGGKAKVRLVNLISDFFVKVDVEAVAAGAAATTASTFANVSFPAILDFVELPKGNYDLKFKISGQTKVLFTVTNVNIEDGKIYTLVARGLYNVATTTTNNRGAAVTIIINK